MFTVEGVPVLQKHFGYAFWTLQGTLYLEFCFVHRPNKQAALFFKFTEVSSCRIKCTDHCVGVWKLQFLCSNSLNL